MFGGAGATAFLAPSPGHEVSPRATRRADEAPRGAAIRQSGVVPEDADRRGPAAMTGLDPTVAVAENYRRFASVEAAGRSPRYERLAVAVAVADDAVIISFLERLPAARRQPNLLFAAARFVLGRPPDRVSLHALLTDRPAELVEVMQSHRTQTNEPARCATLMPVLASLPGPLALLEVGAAAGLTLVHDVYSYDYGGHTLVGLDPKAPTLSCRTNGPVPLPRKVPDVIWRAGIDLNPLDVTNNADMQWLACLVWPDEDDRAERLHLAIGAARRRPPHLHRGDLLEDLQPLAAMAPPEATLVIYHSAVLAYVDQDKRRDFAAAVGGLGAVWLSNEGAAVLPGIISNADPGDFLLVKDGDQVLARSDPHGTWLIWIT